MFKLPSLTNLFTEATATLKRFPLAILAAIVGSFAAMYYTHLDWEYRKFYDYVGKIIMCSYLGLNLFIAADLNSESRSHTPLKRLFIQLCGLLVLIGYYFTLPDFEDFGVQETVCYILYVIGLHLLVSFVPFISKGNINGFWQYNKTLFLRFFTSALYTGVLYIGLALALAAIDVLFTVVIKSDVYTDLWFFLVGVFNTWFFLSGVPKQMESLETISDYPKGLKIFTQFVLLPLVTVYLVILYAYGAKITIAMELPKGWVSYLVIFFSIAGILSLLLIWPVREKEGNGWIKIFSRWFFRALYPLIILLGLAIYERVSQYGVTENRYFVLLIAAWLVVVATYFLISKTKSIKMIPVTLCIITFLSSFGPWGAFSISENSQVERLEKILTEEKILVDGKIKKAVPELKGEKAIAITDIVEYLDKVHGFRAIQPWFNQNIDTVYFEKNANNQYKRKRRHQTSTVLALMGVKETNRYDDFDQEDFFLKPNNEDVALDIKGFDYYDEFNTEYSEKTLVKQVFFGNDSMDIKIYNYKMISVKYGKQIKNISLETFAKTLKQKYSVGTEFYKVPNDRFVLKTDLDSFNVVFHFTDIHGSIDEESKMQIDRVAGKVLIRRK